jgi:hypothetical protein
MRQPCPQDAVSEYAGAAPACPTLPPGFGRIVFSVGGKNPAFCVYVGVLP